MMPKSVTDVMSRKTLAWSSAARAGVDQYGHEATGTPAAARAFDPQSAKAPVIPHGRPASASVATLTAARPSAPAASGQGPRTTWCLTPNSDPELRPRTPTPSRRLRSMKSVAAAMVAKTARLIASAGHTPSVAISEIGFSAGVFSHHGMCTMPMTDPAMNAASVASIRVFPPPVVYSVPDAHPPPSCMPTLYLNAPTTTETPTGDTDPRTACPNR